MEQKPVGRPSLYKPEYCEKLIQHMARPRSFESFAAVIDVNRDTLYEWVKVHEDFSDALTRGRAKHLLAMEDSAYENLVEEPGKGRLNTALYKLFMVNIHGWRSEPKEDSKPDQTIKIVIDSDDANL